MTKHRVLAFGVAALLAVGASARAALDQSKKPAEAYPSEVASAWFDTLYDIVRVERTAPPPASRIYGLSAVALYEAVVGGSDGNRSLVGQLNGLGSLPGPRQGKKYHWPTVANAALATAARGLFPGASQGSRDLIDAREAWFAAYYREVVPGPMFAQSVDLGKEVAAAVLAWCAGDGFSTYNACPYVPADVPGRWQPTPPAFAASPLQPCWGQIRPMVLSSGSECAPSGNPVFSTDASSGFYAAALEVRDVGVNLTAEQKTIADYWADNAGATGTPPGHWIAITAQQSRGRGLSLMASAEAFARVGIAGHDAFVECWNTKYVYNLERPVTFIRNGIEAGWSSYIGTPAFPSYPSGHSTASGAASAVLTDMFGTVSFTDTTHAEHALTPSQTPRSFASFEEAAAEAAVSRLYGGIHYRFDNDDGLTSGACIGGRIAERVRFRK